MIATLGHSTNDMRTLVEPNVQLKEINPILLTIIKVVERVYSEHGYEPVITGISREKVYPVGGVHDLSHAIDYRTSNITNPELIRVVIDSALKDIDKCFRVLYHDTGSGFHFHVDWKPDTTFPIGA